MTTELLHEFHQRYVKPLTLALIALTAACQTTAPAPVAVTKVAPPQRATLQRPDPAIARLMAEGDSALARKHLTTPLENNAYLRYSQVLALDPDNSAALDGISNVVETYVAWAIDATYRGYYQQATDYLLKAKAVDPAHSSILPAETLLGSYQRGHTTEYRLDVTAVRARASSVTSDLQKIAAVVNENNATVVIEAPTDKLGRWIYQQMNAVSERRIRARFQLTNRARVHLHY